MRRPTLAERAAKIQKDFESIAPEIVQANKQFFNDVWGLCGAVIEREEDAFGQFAPPNSIMGD